MKEPSKVRKRISKNIARKERGMSYTEIALISVGVLIAAGLLYYYSSKYSSTTSPEEMKYFCNKLPKAELHLHIEGTLEPELVFKIAERNKVELKYKSVEELREKYNFKNLQEFLDLYYETSAVIKNKEDFTELAYTYAKKAYKQGVKYAEIFFDPQSHMERGISFETIITGLREGLDRAKAVFKNDFDYNMIMCFLRHLPESEHFDLYKKTEGFRDKFIGVGLDSTELGNPAIKFKNIYDQAKKDGFKITIHSGEEGPASYVEDAIDILHAERIDHGFHVMDDPKLVERCAKTKIPFTLCPLSNQKLQVCPDLHKYPLRDMMNSGLQVMINSDDPAYFGGYIGDNYYAMVENLNFTKEELGQLAINSFNSTWLDEASKQKYIKKVQDFMKENI